VKRNFPKFRNTFLQKLPSKKESGAASEQNPLGQSKGFEFKLQGVEPLGQIGSHLK